MTESTAPESKVTIDNPAALGDLVREAIRRKLPIVDYGVAHERLGNPPPPAHTRLTQAGGVIEHYQRDLTVRVSAGMKVSDLQNELAAANQFLPIDCDPDVTVGEVLVHNVYGPLRLSYGGPRDLLLGLHYIDGQARDIHVGGRTVKNVAGYDVTRFMVGSLGQFGLVYEATLRTYAIPRQVLAVYAQIKDPVRLSETISEWMLTEAAPTWLALHRLEGHWQLSFAYYGTPKATQVQFGALQKFLGGRPGFELGESAPCSLNDDLAERSVQRTWRQRVAAMVKIVVPPAEAGRVCNELIKAQPALRVSMVPAHGRIFAGADLDAQQAKHLDEVVMRQVLAVGGNRSWLRRPAGAESIAPFGPPQTDWLALNRLHKVMDPHRLLNPCRLFPVEIAPS